MKIAELREVFADLEIGGKCPRKKAEAIDKILAVLLVV